MNENTVTSLLANLKQYWGYPGFRPLQREAMALVMSDRDSLVVLPTGGGKSLCYQVPAISRNGMALVVSPLISLMKDQVDSLQAVGVSAACINSMQTAQNKREVAALIRRRELKLLYIAPERLVQPQTIEFLQGAGVSFIAIDEAHCISQWGHDFRPEYRQLRCLKTAFPDAAVHGYTATATEQVRTDIAEQLGIADAEILVGSFDRPNLQYRVERRTDPTGQLQRILQRHKGESGIVYCISRKNVDSTSDSLNRLGFKALPYHAGMSDEDRRKNQDAFIDEDVNIIVATVAFGMGIDKSNVRFVIHRDMPKDIESWYQEIGRAGRDGLPSDCVMFYSWADVKMHERFLDGMDDPDVRERTRAATVALFDLVERTRCRHQALVAHFDEVIEACGESCDVCSGQPIEDRIAELAVLQAGSGRGRRTAVGGGLGASGRAARGPDVDSLDDAERELFERLRVVRRELADESGVPAYIVFGDKVLLEMVARRPATARELLQVPGVGEAKLERYGAAFLDVLLEG